MLGTNWNLEEDIFIMKLNKVVEFARNLEPTKRNILRIAAKLLDSLGLISPVMVGLRMLLQKICALTNANGTVPSLNTSSITSRSG